MLHDYHGWRILSQTLKWKSPAFPCHTNSLLLKIYMHACMVSRNRIFGKYDRNLFICVVSMDSRPENNICMARKTPFLFLEFYVFKNSRHYYVYSFKLINEIEMDVLYQICIWFVVCLLRCNSTGMCYVNISKINTILKLIFTCTKKIYAN